MASQAVCSEHAYSNYPGFLQTFSICPSLCLWFPHASKNPPLCPYRRKIKSHAWMTGDSCSDTHLQQVFWETHQRPHLFCAACFTGHTIICIPQTMLLPSPCTLLSPTWKIRTPMWGCCSWIIVQHLTPLCLPHWLRSYRLWDWTDLCAAGSWTSWQAVVRWSEWATTPKIPWSSTLVLRRTVSSAYSCTPCTHTTVQPQTAPTPSSNLPMTQRW